MEKVVQRHPGVSIALAALVSAALALGIAGCSGGSTQASYKDGTYTATSSVFDADEVGSGYGEISITVKDGKISDAEFLTYEPDGTLKDENYGKTANDNQAFYSKAQRAVEACGKYAEQLVSTGDPDEVDVISGATISYEEFIEAAEAALGEASK